MISHHIDEHGVLSSGTRSSLSYSEVDSFAESAGAVVITRDWKPSCGIKSLRFLAAVENRRGGLGISSRNQGRAMPLDSSRR
jgi:hypothetical protein